MDASLPSSPPGATSELPAKIRVISLNCWGLKYLATHRHARLVEIGKQIAAASPPPDIVGLQECWTKQDYEAIRSLTKDILPHGKFYFSGIIGGGLAILSRWPLIESRMFRYPLNGRPAAIHRGDWYVGKGVAAARIRIGPGAHDVLEVFNTHLHAPYEREPHDSYLLHRTAQAWEMARLVRHAAERGHMVLSLGDFNMVPLSLAHRLIEAHAPVQDVWRVLHPDSAVGAASSSAERARGRPIPTVEQCLLEHGATCDGKLNTWRWSKDMQKRLARGIDHVVDLSEEDPRARRLDYIFFADNAHIGGGSKWSVSAVDVGMTARHPTLRCSLSDHFSVETTLTRESREGKPEPRDMLRLLSVETYDVILELSAVYKARERRQRKQRLAHFWGSIIITICCLIAVWWSPHNGVAFALMLFAILNLAAGMLDGLAGGFFVPSEMRALREFEWEVRTARDLASVDEKTRGNLDKSAHQPGAVVHQQ